MSNCKCLAALTLPATGGLAGQASAATVTIFPQVRALSASGKLLGTSNTAKPTSG